MQVSVIDPVEIKLVNKPRPVLVVVQPDVQIDLLFLRHFNRFDLAEEGAICSSIVVVDVYSVGKIRGKIAHAGKYRLHHNPIVVKNLYDEVLLSFD